MSSAQGGPPRPGSPSGGPSEPSAPVAFTSDELNYLVYRYLVESGFTHAAYTFGLESDVLNRLAGTDKHPHHRPFDDLDAGAELKATLERKEAMQRVLQNVQQGALVSIVQKGLQYVEVETHLMEVRSATMPLESP